MYQIVAANKKYSEDEIRDRLATVYPEWKVEAADFSDETGWTIRLHKSAEFPFDKDKKDAEDSADDAKDEASDAKDEADDAAEDADDAEDAADDSDDDSDSDDEGDLEDAKKDLVKELNDVIQMAQKTLDDLGSKAQEVADDASAKDDKIKEIADTVNDLGAGPEAELGGLPGEGLGDAPPMPGGPGAPGPVAPGRGAPKRPGAPMAAPSRKRPPGGVRPPGAPSTFSKRDTEIVTHSGRNHLGTPITIVAAATELENSSEFSDYEVVSMTTNADGTFSAKLRLVKN